MLGPRTRRAGREAREPEARDFNLPGVGLGVLFVAPAACEVEEGGGGGVRRLGRLVDRHDGRVGRVEAEEVGREDGVPDGAGVAPVDEGGVVSLVSVGLGKCPCFSSKWNSYSPDGRIVCVRAVGAVNDRLVESCEN